MAVISRTVKRSVRADKGTVTEVPPILDFDMLGRDRQKIPFFVVRPVRGGKSRPGLTKKGKRGPGAPVKTWRALRRCSVARFRRIRWEYRRRYAYRSPRW